MQRRSPGGGVLVFVPPGGFYRSYPGVPFLVKITVCCVVTHIIDLQLRVRAGSRLQLSPHLHGPLAQLVRATGS